MKNTCTNLSIPSARVGEFIQVSSLLREVASQVEEKNFQKFCGQACESISFFIESELYYRHAERYDALNLFRDQSQHFKKKGEKLNSIGIEALSVAVKALSYSREQIKTLNHTRLVPDLEKFVSEFTEYLADSELKPRDVKRLHEAALGCVKSLQPKGVESLIEHLESAATDMLKLRSSPDRGVVDNFPAWKLGGLIIILGISIIAFIHCIGFKCDINSRNSYIAALIVTALVTLAC